MTGHLPSEPIMRAKNPCMLLGISFPYFIARLLTPRCASRGLILTFGDTARLVEGEDTTIEGGKREGNDK